MISYCTDQVKTNILQEHWIRFFLFTRYTVYLDRLDVTQCVCVCTVDVVTSH